MERHRESRQGHGAVNFARGDKDVLRGAPEKKEPTPHSGACGGAERLDFLVAADARKEIKVSKAVSRRTLWHFAFAAGLTLVVIISGAVRAPETQRLSLRAHSDMP